MNNRFNSILQVLDFFKDESTCKDYLAKQRWPNGVECPYCKCTKIYVTNRGYKCANNTCYKKFSVITGTLYENTKIPLRTWFAAMYLLTAHKKGISSHQLARDLNITQRSAWFVLQRIRDMMKVKAPEALKGIVEGDETYVGGENKNRHNNKKIANTQGRSMKDKTAVLGLVERNGRVLAFVIDNTEAVTLQTIITSNVHQDALLITDAYPSYRGLEQVYKHIVVKHGEGAEKYKTTGEHHTNTIEGYWSMFKRMYHGTYHQISSKHLQKYFDELSFRYNRIKLTDCYRFEEAVGQAENGRLTYKQLIGDGKKGKKENGDTKTQNSKSEKDITEKINHERFRSEAEFRGNISGKSEF